MVRKPSKNNYRKYYKEFYNIDFDTSFEVHHIDGDRNNNNIKNLILLPKDVHHALHECQPIFDFSKHDTFFEFASNLNICFISEQTWMLLHSISRWERIRWDAYRLIMDGVDYNNFNFYQSFINDKIQEKNL